MKKPSEKALSWFFRFSLLIKAALASVEVAAGVAAYFVSYKALFHLVVYLTQGELAEDPRDFIANTLLREAHTLSLASHYFIATYLLIHGVIKIWLVIGLLQRRLRYYPVALVIFGLFAAYELYLFSASGSWWVFALAVLDLVIILLAWHEWRVMRRNSGGV